MIITCRISQCQYYDGTICRNPSVLITSNGMCSEVIRITSNTVIPATEENKENFEIFDIEEEAESENNEGSSG